MFDAANSATLPRVAVALFVLATPAAAIEWRTDLTPEQIRATHWGADARHVTPEMKRAVYARDGYTGPHDPRCPCEVDHIGPRCLGGADTMRNLQVQPYTGVWNAHMKDEVEWYVCAHFRHETLSLAAARAVFDGDWRVAYTYGWRLGE